MTSVEAMTSPASDGPAPPAMYTPSQMRLLKIAVIGMGVVLLLGFATVIGRIVYLVNSAPRPEAGGPAAAVATIAVPPHIELPKGATVRSMAISGNRLAVHYEGPGGAGIRIVDLVSGGASVAIPIIEQQAAPR